VIVALARFAALRCPSEIRELRWSDLDWQRKMLVVRSPKTEGSAGHAVRKVPVSPQLQPLLSKLRRESPPDAERIIRSIRCDALNLRTRFLAIIDRAGLKPWPRLFQNLRASCATDFAQSVPNHEAARFVGHSPTVAAQHYLQPSDHNFQAIAGSGPRLEWGSAIPTRKVAYRVAYRWRTGRRRRQPHRLALRGKKSLQIPQHSEVAPVLAKPGNLVRIREMGDGGLEPSTSRV
jgi:hypothetical protein